TASAKSISSREAGRKRRRNSSTSPSSEASSSIRRFANQATAVFRPCSREKTHLMRSRCLHLPQCGGASRGDQSEQFGKRDSDSVRLSRHPGHSSHFCLTRYSEGNNQLVRLVPPSPPVFWNQRVRGKFPPGLWV